MTNTQFFASIRVMEPTTTVELSPIIATIRKAGLTESQANAYLALIKHGPLTPVMLANKTGESRTNAYMICEKLDSLGLATKKDAKKATYSPAHPSALETLAEKRRKVIQRDEQSVKNGIADIISFYYEHAEMPGVRYLEGREGQTKVYEDILAQKQSMYLVRTPNEKKFFGKEILGDFIARRIKNQIEVVALTPFLDDSNTDPVKDEADLLDRQFMPADSYTAPVEIDIYGNRTSFISYGEELTGIIIDNPHIALAMQQIFQLARLGAKHEFEGRPELVEELAQRRAEHSSPDQNT